MRDDVWTRREFLGRGVAIAAVAGTVPTFLSRCAFALDDRAGSEAPRDAKDQPILVVVQLAGGNDGLNTVVPYADDAYHRARPTLAVAAKDVLRLDDHLGLHPTMTGLKSLYDEGSLAVVQAVGYPNPNRSHFRSMEIWETASDSDRQEHYGWIGRYFDCQCGGAPSPAPGVVDDTTALMGLGLVRRQTLAFANHSSAGVTLQRPEQYRWMASDPSPAQSALFASLNQPQPGSGKGEIDFLQRTALNANVSSARIAKLAAGHESKAAYPDSRIAGDLRLVSQMIAGGLPTRVYYVSLGGFDTHAQQENEQPKLLGELSAALAAFDGDLKAQGLRERVLTMTFSEFGRRVAENGSKGTDHGTASVMFLTGGPIKGGLLGRTPSLTDLDHGDLKFNVDFRSVYATVLAGWLCCDPVKVLGREHPTLPIIKT
jgi:uncharacterized protein (DUF1501 family)